MKLKIHQKIWGKKWSNYLIFTPRRGIVVTVRAGGRSGGRLPNLRNPYLRNRLIDFLHSKFCGIV